MLKHKPRGGDGGAEDAGAEGGVSRFLREVGGAVTARKAFEMEPNRHTEFAVTNYLWDLMDAC